MCDADTPGVDVPPPFGPAAGFLGSSPPQMPLFVNAKQQKILQGVRGVPMPSRQTVELKPADSGSEEPAADPPVSAYSCLCSYLIDFMQAVAGINAPASFFVFR